MQEQHKLTKALQQAKMANKPFKFKMRSCRQCDFKTESILVLEGHLLKPHITSRREIQCCFCKYTTRDAKAIVFHMETVHKKLPTMECPPQFYECPFCSFETNVKAKANSHINRCQKDFNNNTNQVPSCDFQLPGVTAKPITIEDMKTYKKKTASHTGAATKGNPNRAHISLLQKGAPAALSGAVASLHHQKFLFSASQNLNHGRGRPKFQQTPASNRIHQVVGSSTEVTSLLNGSPQSNLALARPVKPASDSGGKRSVHAVAPKRPSPGQRPQMSGIMESSKSVAGAFVVCELCDGYMKDLESLGAHMNRVHRVKIHAKLLTSRPPLNCQKCQWRFFTDQGLERHLLGAHGLVTSNMQELTNSNEDGGRCTVCGRFFAAKLVAHMSQVHRVVLKPAHLSYKCTVCTETFNLYRLFERHVYTVHGVGLKRPASGSLDDKPAKQPVTAKRVSDHTTTKTKQESEGSNDIPSKPAPESPTSGSSDTEEEYSEKVAVAPAEPPDSQMGARCTTCEENVEDLREHVEEKPMRGCKIRLCHIEKCDHCLRSFNGMIVMNTLDSGDEDSSEEEEDNTGPADADGPPGAKDADFLEAKNPEVDDQQGEAK
ncbi:hypothetical protein HPB51_006457 [Rhipicephalus microplus]|uniref:MOG interacting and ectopic P-granules protein 1 n=2 Tax=Rhipicephalus microplus TaxID=6941 RepID=A0A9J6E7C3_RHIMP|nr:hypothetical protein HPB51_006457 [Rhipicephalus microplus]